MNNTKMNVGRQIRKIRTEKKVSLRALDELTGITWSELSKIERGKRNLTLDTIEKIAKALDCEVEVLINPVQPR